MLITRTCRWCKHVWQHLYDPGYAIQEAWLWEADAYTVAFDAIKRLSPAHHRQGKRLR